MPDVEATGAVRQSSPWGKSHS